MKPDIFYDEVDSLIPLEQVLDDMYADRGPATWAAKSYYYENYASEKERIKMDREERLGLIFGCGFISLPIVLLLLYFVT